MNKFPSFPYVPRFSMVILNELYARPSSLTDFVSSTHFVSSVARRLCGVRSWRRPRHSFTPVGRWCRVLGFHFEPSIFRVLKSYTTTVTNIYDYPERWITWLVGR